jgi:UDP-N-acetyl-2-amino-2-deoxyglucuronate dehydrogenase
MKNFALIGAAGFIAPRHLKAIKDTNNNLIAALDKFDSVGVMDSYFPKSDFFTEFERFDRHIYNFINEKGQKLDYVSICTPNYLHDSNIRFALRNQADAICEKSLVLNPWNVDALQSFENETGKKVFTILQLRLHPSIIALREKVTNGPKDKIYDIDLTYITSRGNWYYTSWKGDVSKSGGVASNIGIHFYDMLTWIFGEVKSNTVHLHNHDRAAGLLIFENARVRWFLSINADTLPEDVKLKGQTTYRSIQMDGDEIEFSDGFKDLHTISYKHILEDGGFGLEEAKTAIEIVHEIRNAEIKPLISDFHPFCLKKLSSHPFESKK